MLTGTIAADSAPVVNVYAVQGPGDLRPHGVHRGPRPSRRHRHRRPGRHQPGRRPAAEGRRRRPHLRRRTDVAPARRGSHLHQQDQLQQRRRDDVLPAGGGRRQRQTARTGCSRVGTIWKAAGLDTNAVVLVDGSGLAGNYVTPNSQVQLETIMSQRPDAQEWRDTLPILGVDGSLYKVQADGPAKGKVSGKTGTLFGRRRIQRPLPVAGEGVGRLHRHRERPAPRVRGVLDEQHLPRRQSGIFAANDDVGKVVASIQQAY